MRRAIIVGRAAAALEEYRAACAMCEFDDIFVVGEMGVHFPDRIDHWVSFHAEIFDLWTRRRQHKGYPPAGCYWGAIYKGRKLGINTTQCKPLEFVQCLGGSSGFLAVCAALHGIKADRVVLAGMPLTSEGAHHGEDKPWKEADRYWPTWLEHKAMLDGKVKSMSGRTRDEFGEPTIEWLNGE